eukprot:CAMPEP_0116092796 /NCGR_PEP_ID=MMETSP0327-20121206/8234_1 /TAXON_ID=44447 /ORGANISM="Pseudo-nitzschia delicatissima, Strain B596" /LENGTH=713 /DNA_ID=CAMNT_0003584247 /DNA_START=54 /DNA_END=2195 /DNA_ORIENTATION=+
MATSKANSGVAPSKIPKLIKRALIGAGLKSIDDNVLSKCVALASTLQLTPETMAEVWEAHSLNKQNLTELTMHQFEAYKNVLIQASNTVPTPDVPQSLGNNNRGAAMVSRKREPAATMVTPNSSSKRQKQPSPDIPTSSVDQVASKGNAVPSPVRSSKTSGTSSAVKKAPVNLPKYEDRTKVGHVVVSYPAGHISEDNVNASDSKQRRCVLTTNCVENDDDDDVTRYNIKEPYRHMFTTLEDRANALEGHLVRTKTAIVEDLEKEQTNKSKVGDEVEASFEEVNVPRQHPSTCVGRICNEAHNGKMNSTSVVLEGSSSSCGGARVNVDLSHMQKKEQQQNGYSLFPGQIVAIEGINGTGRKITATKIKEGFSMPPASSSMKSIQNYYGCDDDQEKAIAPLKVISACGPFTTAKSMDYAPFVDLMSVVLEENPDVVILTGPFVDVRQEAVQSGRVTCDDEDDQGEAQDVVVDYETLFSQRITAVIEEVFEDKSMVTEFVLVPALEDAVAKFVYPQPPLKDRFTNGGEFLNVSGAEGIEFGTLGLHRLTKPQANSKSRVHCLPNPCTFRINELVFGVTSTDVLFHMSVEETNANLPSGSRLRRISQHMIQQQSYYPLFPPNKSVNLDLKQQDGWRMPCRPDVLVVPSRLTPFCAPVLGSTMAVNPGHLTKGTTGGTYSVMNIDPIKKEKLKMDNNDDRKIAHDVQNRMKVQIKKI